MEKNLLQYQNKQLYDYEMILIRIPIIIAFFYYLKKNKSDDTIILNSFRFVKYYFFFSNESQNFSSSKLFIQYLSTYFTYKWL